MDAIKGAFLSKTMWFGVAAAVLPLLFQPIQDWIAANPSASTSLLAAVMMALRAFTNQSLAEKGTPPNDKAMTP